MTPIKKLWTEIRYWIILLLVFFVLFEMISSMILYRKYTSGKLAILHYTQHDNREFAYEPWLMFRSADRKSSSLHVNGFERLSEPSSVTVASSKDTVDIFFFGGGSLYGKDLQDKETIPSQFLQVYKASNPSKSLRVHNFGVPWYYSRQELMLLTRLIFEGRKPDMVIFLDGMTDFSAARMLYYDKPYFSYALQQTFDGKMFQKGDGHFVDTTAQLFKDPDGMDAKKFNDELISKYINNITQAAKLCRHEGIKSYFFCEPVPYYNYPAKESDTNIFHGSYNRFIDIYPALETYRDTAINFHFLGNMVQNEKAGAFLNEMNYSPSLSRKIAEQIYSTVKNDLQ